TADMFQHQLDAPRDRARRGRGRRRGGYHGGGCGWRAGTKKHRERGGETGCSTHPPILCAWADGTASAATRGSGPITPIRLDANTSTPIVASALAISTSASKKPQFSRLAN